MLRTADAVQAAADADAATLLSLAGDVLAEHLDTMQGASITDLSIFRSHAARYSMCTNPHSLQVADTVHACPHQV